MAQLRAEVDTNHHHDCMILSRYNLHNTTDVHATMLPTI
jgi:hypothetical protein